MRSCRLWFASQTRTFVDRLVLQVCCCSRVCHRTRRIFSNMLWFRTQLTVHSSARAATRAPCLYYVETLENDFRDIADTRPELFCASRRRSRSDRSHSIPIGRLSRFAARAANGKLKSLRAGQNERPFRDLDQGLRQMSG